MSHYLKLLLTRLRSGKTVTPDDIEELFVDKILNLLTQGLESITNSLEEEINSDPNNVSAEEFRTLFRQTLEEVRLEREQAQEDRWAGVPEDDGEEKTTHILPGFIHDKFHDEVVDAVGAQLKDMGSRLFSSASDSLPKIGGLATIVLTIGWTGYQALEDGNTSDVIARHILAMLRQKHLDDYNASQIKMSKAMSDYVDSLPYALSARLKAQIQSGDLRTISSGGVDHITDPISTSVYTREEYEHASGLLRAQNTAASQRASRDIFLLSHLKDDPHVSAMRTQLLQNRSGMSHISMRYIEWGDVYSAFAVASRAYGDEDGNTHLTRFLPKRFLKSPKHKGVSPSTKTEFIIRSHITTYDTSYIIIGFKGTSSVRDAITDVSFNLVPPVKLDFPPAATANDSMIHSGFQEALIDIEPILMKELRKFRSIPKDTKVIITGHSLGGALAICCSMLSSMRKFLGAKMGMASDTVPLRVITFGSPRVGNEGFSKSLELVKNLGIQRFTNSGDVVPFLPRIYDGYSHAGIEFRIARGGLWKVVHGDGVTEEQRANSSGERNLGLAHVNITVDHGRSTYAQRLTHMRSAQEATGIGSGSRQPSSSGVNASTLLNIRFAGSKRKREERSNTSLQSEIGKTLQSLLGGLGQDLESSAQDAVKQLRDEAGVTSTSSVMNHLLQDDDRAQRFVNKYVGESVKRRSIVNLTLAAGSKASASALASQLVHEVIATQS